MLYRRNEKGRYEGVTDRGQVVQFEDAAEMVASRELRKRIDKFVGCSETVEYDESVKEIFLISQARKSALLAAVMFPWMPQELQNDWVQKV